MARRSFLSRRRPENEEMSLQITSMADIFTIVLIFMLKSYGSTGTAVQLTQPLQVPQAMGKTEALRALRLEISESAVAIDGRPVVRIKGYEFDPSDVGENGVSRSLSLALSRERGRSAGNSKILVLADQRAPYEAIKVALASAAIQGYTDIKLAVSDAH